MLASRGRRSGLTLIESLLALSISAVVLLGLLTLLQTWTQNIREDVTARVLRDVTNAGEAWLRANAQQVIDAAPGTVNVDPGALVSGGYLSPGYIGQTGFGQDVRLRFRSLGERLEGIVFTEGGDPLTDAELPFIAAQIGGNGGYVPASATATPRPVLGAFGNWKTTTAQIAAEPAAGQLVSLVSLDRSSALSPFLYRVAVPGFPEANRMETDLLMAGHDITGARTLEGEEANISIATQAGSLEVNGAVDISGSLTVDGQLGVGGQLSTASLASAGAITAGRLTASQDVTARSLIVSGDVTLPRVSATTLEAGLLTVSGSATIPTLAADRLEVSELTVSGELQAGLLSSRGPANLFGEMLINGNSRIVGILRANEVAVEGIISGANGSFDNAGIGALVVQSCSGC